MLNSIWPMLVLSAIFFAVFNQKVENVNSAVFVSFENVIDFIFKFGGILCFWSGMIKIIKNTSILGKIEKILRPFVNKFFKNTSDDVKKLITLNMVSNLMGIGNAATPAGIEAMKRMEKESTANEMSKEMNLFVLMNTLSIQLFPTTVISILASQGSDRAGKIIVPVWITSILTFFIIMFLGNLFFKERKLWAKT